MNASFDRIAPFYDILASWIFQGNIRRAQRQLLPEIPENSDVLFLGGGSGFLLPDLFLLKKVRHIAYVEASARMLSRAQQTVTRFQRHHPRHRIPSITFVHGSEREIPPTHRYQAVITNFVLDMYPDHDLSRLMHYIHRHLTKDACWLFTDFRLSSHSIHRHWQPPFLRLMFRFFRLTTGLTTQTLPDYTRQFRLLGWECTREQSSFGDFIVSRVYRPAIRPGKGAALSDT